jgi:hypothetical protein
MWSPINLQQLIWKDVGEARKLYIVDVVKMVMKEVFFFVIPFHLQSVLVHSANCVKTCIQFHVEECSLALLRNL